MPDDAVVAGHDASPTPTRRVAVIGAGPSGLFAAQALASQDRLPVEVDIYDRMPTPFGLLRYGVAPDHESIRSVAQALAAVFRGDHIHFCGLVDFGTDVTREDVLAAYDAVIYAAGASEDMKMDIPGELLTGSTSAREFVAWYGGHPDARPYDLAGIRTVAAIGVGNVAVDVARILVKPTHTLEWTDMPQNVLRALHAGDVRDVYVVGRRGPHQASFTTKELRELLEVEGVQVTVSPGAFDGIDEAQLDRRTRANVTALREAAARQVPDAHARLHFLFWSRPVELLGEAAVEGMVVERTAMEGGRLVGTGQTQTIPVQLVMRAIGYRGVPLPGVPFDAGRGVIPNVAGRVTTPEGHVLPREYVVGWIKRGPIGVIGTNKSDASETVTHLIDDLASAAPLAPRVDLVAELAARGFTPSSLADWERIDAAEKDRGGSRGRERTKIDAWHELLALARGGHPGGDGDPDEDEPA